VLSTSVYPIAPSTHAFSVVFRQAFWLLETFWNQMGNSFYIGIVVALLTLAIGSLTSFTISRMRIRSGWMLTNAALLTYVIPMSFLAIPFYGIMGKYGLTNSPLAVIAVEVTFATPYAIFIFQQYSASIPFELDEAARIDGASPLQLFRLVYLPLMLPSLVAVGTYALLLAWNEYLYAFLLLSDDKSTTLGVALGSFLSADDSPWELLMTTGLIYALPPAAIYYAFKRYMVGGLTAGAVKS
jgi:multiple sugar transport system permease protein